MGEQSEVLIPVFGVLDITGEVVTMWAILLTVTVLSLIATRHAGTPGKIPECGGDRY